MFIICMRLFWNFSPKNLSSFWSCHVILTPKNRTFWASKEFFQIFAFLTTLTWKLSHKTIMEIVHSMWEIILKDWIEIFSLYWTYDVILTPKTALLGIFSKFFQISAFFTLKRKLYHEIMVEIVHSILKIILNQFYQ